MKYLSGKELVDYIKERQAKQVRSLRQAYDIFPKLAIVQTITDPVIDTYVRLKRNYGEDILVEVEHHMVSQNDVLSTISSLNDDRKVHAIIVQLPLGDIAATDTVLNTVDPEKDVDGLGASSLFDPATALAINWLCAGYNIDLSSQSILVIGKGRLVGAPLAKMWKNSGYNVVTADKEQQEDLEKLCHEATLIVSGTGVPGLLTSEMVGPDTILIDAGTASENGKISGDLSPDIYNRHDLSVTPVKGGVGPLTVAALFDNVIRAAQQSK